MSHKLKSLPPQLEKIHSRALTCTARHKKSESDLLAAIMAVQKYKVFRYFDCTSVYEYCVKILKIDAGIVYGLTTVAKKCSEVPELQREISLGNLSVSTAKRFTAVLTTQNKNEWIQKAQTLTIRQLEKEVVRVSPKSQVKERASYLTSQRVRLELGLTEKLMMQIRRIQDLESQRQRRSIDLENTFQAMAATYLAKNDPQQKAKRAQIRSNLIHETSPTQKVDQLDSPSTRKAEARISASATSKVQNVESANSKTTVGSPSNSKSRRISIPKKILHQVHLRDKGLCQYQSKHIAQRCGATRFIEIHHEKPVAEGGENKIDNLITLCSEHHKILHLSG